MSTGFVSCPTCHCLVLDTLEERREHRAADNQNRHVIEALRRGLRAATDAAASALQFARDLQREIEGLDGRVRDVAEAPEPELVVGEWPADELDDPEPAHDDPDNDDPDNDDSSTTRDGIRDYFTSPRP